MYDIITIGSNTMDIFVNVKAKTSSKFIMLPLCDKILSQSLYTSFGGGGLNTALSFAKAGLRVAYAGNLADDEVAENILELLERNNVEFIGRRLDTKTNFSVIIDTKKKSRTIIAYKDEKNQKYVVPKLKTDWIYVASMDKTCLSFLHELVNYAKKKKIKLAINPSMYFVKTAKPKLKKLLTNFEVVVMNKDEAKELYGDYKKSGVKLLSVTDAKNGAEVFYEGHVYKHKVHNIKVVERTGAGDAYASMFVAAYIKGMPIETCCKVALAQSESVISYYGATNKLLTWNELIKSKDIKVEKVKLT